jgi:hypothetical protein
MISPYDINRDLSNIKFMTHFPIPVPSQGKPLYFLDQDIEMPEGGVLRLLWGIVGWQNLECAMRINHRISNSYQILIKFVSSPNGCHKRETNDGTYVQGQYFWMLLEAGRV